MKVVILAGGFGTRISEESYLKPKPMVEICDMPILWHIMKIYSYYGYYDFVICCGYKAYVIKNYFANYGLYQSDVTFDFSDNNIMINHNNYAEPWRVTLVDTGLNTMTGGRIKRIQKYIGNETFMLTYGDGLSDIDITKLVQFHKTHGKFATITAVNAGQRFGVLDIDADNMIKSIREKNMNDGSMINAGFMVFEPNVFEFIEGDNTILEKEPLMKLSEQGELMAYKHTGFWQCLDTQREKQLLEDLCTSGKAPWRKW